MKRNIKIGDVVYYNSNLVKILETMDNSCLIKFLDNPKKKDLHCKFDKLELFNEPYDGKQIGLQFNTGGREKYYKRLFVGDCVTRALTIYTGRDYKSMYDQINENILLNKFKHTKKKYQARNGVFNETSAHVLCELEMEKNKKVKKEKLTITQCYQKYGNFVGMIEYPRIHHVFAVIDGLVCDNGDPRFDKKNKEKQVIEIWQYINK